MTALLVSTRNAHKIEEMRNILGPDFQCFTLDDFPGAPAVIEDADTFSGNAAKKVLSMARWLRENPGQARSPLYFLADDSGLEVDALNGAPGVHSARFAADDKTKGNSPDFANNAKLLRLLENVPLEKRLARFRCVLALLGESEGAAVNLFDGTCEGVIAPHPSGRGGFGYDPLFIPSGHRQSFADLGEGVKNEISHRARALAKLKLFLTREVKRPPPALPS